MENFADLHIHTHFSDGSQSPREVIEAAKAAGLSLISVCDHNTDKAYDELPSLCDAAGISLIQGMEVDARWRDLNLHILAYGYDRADTRIEALIRRQKAEYDLFDEDFIINLSKDFPCVTLEGYHAYETPPGLGGWKDTNYLVACGAVSSVADGLALFERYAKHPWHFLSLSEVCRIVKAAGGIPVLAHPGNWFLPMPDNFIGILSDMLDQGVAGIECYYPSHTKALTETCITFAKEHGIAITSGGDGHGAFNRVIDGITYDIGIVKTGMSRLSVNGIGVNR